MKALRRDVDASFAARLLMLRGERARLSGDEAGALRCLAQALHQSPSQPEVSAYLHSRFASQWQQSCKSSDGMQTMICCKDIIIMQL